jgi:uracil-DNA glycosylase family 4
MTAARRLDVFDPREFGAKCDWCPLNAQTPVPPARAERKTRFVILGEAPGYTEEKVGVPFVGASGKMLNKLLHENDLDRRDAHVSNVLLCRPTHEDQFERARACCAPRLFKELEALPKEAPIIAMGKEAAKATLGIGGILRSRGFIWKAPALDPKVKATLKNRVAAKAKKEKDKKAKRAARTKLLRDKIAGRIVLPTIHPAFVLRSQIWQAVLEVDVERIAKFIKNDNHIALEDRKPFVVVSTARELRKLGKKLGRYVACDIETVGLRFDEAEIRCVGIGDKKLTIVAFPWKEKMKRVLTRIFRTRIAVGHNFICFDAPVLRHNGVQIDPEKIEDTMIASHAFASHLPKSLLHVGSVFCNLSPWKHEAKGEGRGEKGQPTQIDKLPPDKLVRYNASDCQVTIFSWHRMQHDLEPERHTYEIDKKIATLCSGMMVAGFQFDIDRCRELDAKLERRSEKLLRRIRDLTRMSDFNPANPYDIRKALYRKFGAPLLQLTPGGLPATGKAVLEQFKTDDSKIGRLAGLILRWRGATKTRGTFLSVYVSRDGRVHPGWRVGPVSGRLACRAPNVMNIPRYTPDKETRIVDLCDRVRECYIAKPGYVIVYFDLAQAEARFAANLSGDKAFIKACAGDVHAGNAKVIFPEEAAKGWLDGKEAKEGRGKPFRDVAKNSGFAIYYLAGWETVYERLTADGFEVSPSDCRAILDAIHSTYTGYYDFVARNVEFVKRNGYLRTFQLGRIRWFGPVPNPSEVANHPIQGGIADYMNDRLLQLDQKLHRSRLDATIIAQVHDAGLIEVRKDQPEDVKALVHEVYDPPVEIEGCDPFYIPIDLKCSDRWSDL